MLCIAQTSLHSYEYITGLQDSKKGNKGTTMQVRFPEGSFFPPLEKFFEPGNLKLRDFKIGFLSTIKDKEKWIFSNLESKNLYLNEIEGVEVRFLSIGGEFTKLDSEFQSRLMSGEWISLDEVFNEFPKKPGSKARRHTLIFRPGIWGIIKNPEEQSEVDIYYDIINCNFSEEQTRNRVCIVEIEGFKIGILDEREVSMEKVKSKIEINIEWFTPGILKSLIQKCIRYRAIKVRIDDELHETEDVLIDSFLSLYTNPGSFVPDLNIFVKGSESAFKRLAISLIEDSYINREVILSLFLAALAARKGWIFSRQYINKCIEWCEMSMTNRFFEYDVNFDQELNLKRTDRFIVKSIETLKSFKTDINMIKSVCHSSWSYTEGKDERPEEMNIVHCLDQHCTSSVLYCYFNDDKLNPEQIASIFWNESSKINPRKKNVPLNPEVQKAQLRYWKIKNSNPEIDDSYESSVIMKRNLDQSWICGMINTIESKIGNKNIISFFHPEDISQIISVRAPSRNKEQQELNQDELEESIKFVERKMSSFKLRDESVEIDNTFKFKDKKFWIKDDNSEYIEWIDWCNGNIEIPIIQISISEDNIYEDYDRIIQDISTKSKFGIAQNWREILEEHLLNLELSILFRISMYIRVVSPKISMLKISRDGTGTYQSVGWEDHHVFKFLLLCCYVAPAAIKIHNHGLDLEFEIVNVFVWNRIKKLVFSILSDVKLYDWKVKNLDSRKLFNHQREAVQFVIDRVNEGKRGNILWFPVGSGKTLIAITVLFELMKRINLPKYVVYTFPAESFSSVSGEFINAGFTINVINNKNSRLKKFQINFIEHDNLRIFKDHLVDKAIETFFIFDEMHTMTNIGTLRTSVALYLSKITQNFLAMTGTLFRNPDPEGVIEWMSQIVNFRLDKNNYMIGVASLISKKIDYGIEENRISVDLPIDESPEYWSLVSEKLGGTAQETNFTEAVKFCYDMCKREIVNLTVEYLQTEQHIFVVALNKEMQFWLNSEFERLGYKCFCITKTNTIDMKNPGSDIDIVITTIRLSTGYNLTACKTLIQSVYFSNQATRTQMEGRLIRMGQKSKIVNIVTVHTGILSYVLKNYDEVRSIERALKDLAKTI